MAEHDPTCSICGDAIDPMTFDIRAMLPDAVLDLDPADREATWSKGPFLEVDGVGRFVRCLLPVHLTGGTVLTLGTWLTVAADELSRARMDWNSPRYPELELDGTLANAIKPWAAILGERVRVAVRNPEHIPYVVATESPLVARVLTDVWDRDEVLQTYAHALPVTIRRRVTDDWSIVREAGFTSLSHEGTLRFVGQSPRRTVIIEPFTTQPDQPAEEVLAAFLQGAPPADGTIDERDGDELRHAFWRSTTVDGHAQQELHGVTIRPGTMLRVACIHDEPTEHEWAVQTWRSVRYHAPEG